MLVRVLLTSSYTYAHRFFTHMDTHSLLFFTSFKKDKKKSCDTKISGQIQPSELTVKSHAPYSTKPPTTHMFIMRMLHCNISAVCTCCPLPISTSNSEPISVCRPQASTPASAAQRQYPSEPTPFPAFIISFMCSRLLHCWLN